MDRTDPRDPLVDAAKRLAAELDAAAPERDTGGDASARHERAAVLMADIAGRLRRVGAHMSDERFALLVLELARARARDEDDGSTAT